MNSEGRNLIVHGVKQILEGLKEGFGLDIDDENFRETPERVARAYDEIFHGVQYTDIQVKDILKKSFPAEFSQMVVATNIRAFSMCPHHLLPVDYNVHVGYIPAKGGRVFGISKLSRLTVALAQRPVLQEQFVDDVTDALMSVEGAVGAACVAFGKHYCMIMRGAKQSDSTTITSSVKGVFKTDGVSRKEFMDLCLHTRS